MFVKKLQCIFGLLAAVLVTVAAAEPMAAQTKLLRFPDLSGEHVVFTYAGDLWRAPASGGTAVRLTTHPGLELFPKFSPDGRWIAFTGQYDGDEQVYVMPAIGGVPKQLTFYPARGPLPPRWGYDHQVYGWTPDGGAVLFRSHRDAWDISDSRLFTVDVDGGMPVALPMPKSGSGALSPDGEQVLYSPLARDFRSWKRYQGGWAQDLYLFDLETNQATQITDHPRSDRDPMWIGDTLYFTSDRDGTLNIYAAGTEGGAARQVTSESRWDVRWPSADEVNGRIVYELGGELAILDPATGASQRIAINVPDDLVDRRPSRISAADDIESATLSPKGERVLFVARGDVFTAPVEDGPVRNLTASPGAHDKWARWSPDGSQIVFISDRDGEEELYLVAQDGRGEPEQITDGHAAMLFAPTWSPDGERIAFSDKEGRLFVLTLADRGIVEVADDPRGQIGGYTWSPKGGHLAYTLSNALGFSSIYVWTVDGGVTNRVTGDLFNEFSPAWSPKGDYLYYIADRTFVPQLGAFEWNYVVNRESDIYALALRGDVGHPFPPKSDEVTIDKDDENGENDENDENDENGEEGGDKKKPAKDAQKKDGDEKNGDGAIEIDFEGLAERVARIPLPGDNYAALAAKDGHLIYALVPAFYYGRGPDGPITLNIFSLEDREAKQLAEGINSYWLSDDGGKVLVGQMGGYQLYPATPQGAGSGERISTSGLMVDRVPEEEWAAIFDEVWRRFRDWFYVPNMHGYDWEALREQYRPLLEHVGHRSDLNYLLSEMVAELNVSHAYITGGDYDLPDRPSVALPGARFELDEASGRYRIAKIYPGHNEEALYRSPLTEIGVDASEGDYVLAIDGEELTAGDNPYQRLRHKADRPVELTLNSSPSEEGSRRVTFQPLTGETSLIYLDWVLTNHRKVTEMTDGRVGYLHIPDMGANGIREFIKWFYGQLRTEGLVVDVRGNGGGNVSAMLIERLSRDPLGYGYSRNDDHASPYPQAAYAGHMVCLLNETSASDGDIFPYMFRQAGLGPLIGKRSWGGVVGISGHGPLLDGGGVSVPEFATTDVDGQWVIEGYGVAPDIEIDNDPMSVLAGRDPQLERAIDEVLATIAAEPVSLPPKPADPVRTQQRFDGVPQR